jgi:chromosome segregation ATPase
MARSEDKKTLEGRRNQLVNEIGQLKDELKQRESQLPAHSIRPHQILAIEELEEKIKQKKEQLRSLEKKLSLPPHSLRGNPIPED